MSSDKIKTKSSKKGKRSRAEDVVDDDHEATAAVMLSDKVESTEVNDLKQDQVNEMEEEDAPKSTSRRKTVTEAVKEGEEGEELEDVPALSHKEKRLAKRRKLAGLPERERPATSTTFTRIGDQPPPVATAIGNTPAKSAHGIWVGNLSFATTSKELIAWFGDRGLADVTRINMPNGKRAHENNRGFAYVDFPTATDVEIAVGLSEQHLDGRKLLIKSSSDFTGRPAPSTSAILTAASVPPSALVEPTLTEETSTTDPATPIATGNAARPIVGVAQPTLNRTARKILDRQKNPPGPTLFLGNLGFETTVEDIKEMFDAHQKAMASWAPRDKKEKKAEEKEKKRKAKRESKAEGSGEEQVEGSDSGDESSDEEKKESDNESDDEEKKDDEGELQEGDAEGQKPKRVRAKKFKQKEKEPLDLSKAKDAGIRKVRLGTFEDTGKCKGWAFVDFHLPEQCTRALLNIRNHTLAGRALNVEYASSDAVRRGAIGTRGAAPGGRGGGRGGASSGRGRGGATSNDGGGERSSRGGGKDWDDSDVRAVAEQGEWGVHPERAARTYDGPPARGRGRGGSARGGVSTRGSRGGSNGASGERRAKPGAALASAQRASEGIVPSTGRKITFD